MVGMESRKLNSRAEGRSRPASWPAAMVDMEREVPGKMAESVWQRPIQMAWARLISSTWVVLALRRALQASMIHMTMPPMSSARAIALRLPRFFSLHLCSSRAGAEVKAKAMRVREMGWLSQCAVAVLAPGKGAQEADDAAQEEQQERQDRAQLDDDGVHLPVGVVEGDIHERFGNAQVRRGADGKELGQAFHDAQNDGLNVWVQEASGAHLMRRLSSRGGRSTGPRLGQNL